MSGEVTLQLRDKNGALVGLLEQIYFAVAPQFGYDAGRRRDAPRKVAPRSDRRQIHGLSVWRPLLGRLHRNRYRCMFMMR